MNNILFLEMETDIDFSSVQESISSFFIDDETYYMESSVSDSITKFFETTIKRIREIIENAIAYVRKIFSSKEVEEIDEKFNKFPFLKKKKVKTIDYQKLQHLNTEMQAALQGKDLDEIEEKMAKYRKQRNTVIAAGAVAVISLGTAIHFIKKKDNEAISDLNKKLKRSEIHFDRLKNQCTRISNENSSLKSDNKKLKNKLEVAKQKTVTGKVKVMSQQAVRGMNNTKSDAEASLAAAKQIASAEAEVLQNMTKDTINNVKDVVSTCKKESSIVIDKSSSIISGVENTVENIKKVTSGEASFDVKNSQKSKLKDEIISVRDKMQKARKIMNDESQSKEKRRKAEEYIKLMSPKIKTLKARYDALR